MEGGFQAFFGNLPEGTAVCLCHMGAGIVLGGKPLQGQAHYFAYDEGDFTATLRQCTAFINRYNNNPERAMRVVRREQKRADQPQKALAA